MVKPLRRLGFGMIVLGILIIIFYVAPPLRWAWLYFSRLPVPILIGLGVSAAGLVIVMSALLWERWVERDEDRSLRDN